MQIKIEQLEQELKNRELQSIYLLYGEERFLLDTCIKKITKKFGETVNGINYITIQEQSIQQLIPDIQTPAFGYEKKLIIVRSSKLFEKQGRKKDNIKEELIEKISEYINENIDEIRNTTVLIFIEENADKNKLYNVIEKNGIICNFEELKPNQISVRLKTICNSYKVEISNIDINYIIENCGTNMQILINEIRKLIEYVGENGTIKKEDIDLLCIKQIQAVIFDLTDNLGKKEISKSIQILDNLIYSKEPIQKILVTLYNHFKKIYITKIAIEQNKDLIQSLNLKPNQMFLTSKYKLQAGYFTSKELRKILQDITDLDSNYKQGLIDLDIGLRTILCGM